MIFLDVKVMLKFVVIIVPYLSEVLSHGVLVEPPNRSSLWRFFDSKQPINYNDNELFCGGAAVQHQLHGGRCGICGDNFGDRQPRANENTGIFGNGIVTRRYVSSSEIQVVVNLTANHLGTFTYSLCVLPDIRKPEPEECFLDLLLSDGRKTHRVLRDEVLVVNRVRLPAGLRCERCVFRWHYTTGNSWGICPNGTQGLGCGPQETFRACSDIAIV